MCRVFLRQGLTFFALAASNCDPPDLYLLSG
jgi:hypothetical protein